LHVAAGTFVVFRRRQRLGGPEAQVVQRHANAVQEKHDGPVGVCQQGEQQVFRAYLPVAALLRLLVGKKNDPPRPFAEPLPHRCRASRLLLWLSLYSQVRRNRALPGNFDALDQ
jgi:hypothetical protein